MADEKKVKIDIDSAESVGKKIGEEIGKGINESLDKLDSKELQKKADSAFSFDGIKKNFSKAVMEGLKDSKKSEVQQNKMNGILKKNAELTKSFTNAMAGGGKASEVLSAGMKLAGNSLKGMVANINPLMVAMQAAKKFLEYYQVTLEQSRKFIGQGSLFTDKATMSMMQRTGQDAAGAQGTQRGLDRLGITFEDLQNGLVTKEQVAEFEKIRKEESERLREIQDVGMPVFLAMQKGALAIAGAKQKVEDAITMIFAKSRGVLTFASTLEQSAYLIGEVVSMAIDILAPVVNIMGHVLGMAMKFVNVIMNVVKKALSAVQPFINEINNFLNAAFKAMEPIFYIIEFLFDALSSLLLMGGGLELLTKAMEGLTWLMEKMGEGITWVIKKFLEGIKWAWDGTMSFLNTALNVIPKAFHDMIRSLVKTATLGIKDIGEYQGKDFAIGAGVSNSLDRAIQAFEGDTINYNYDSSTTNNNSGNSNQDLFANMYTIVND